MTGLNLVNTVLLDYGKKILVCRWLETPFIYCNKVTVFQTEFNILSEFVRFSKLSNK